LSLAAFSTDGAEHLPYPRHLSGVRPHLLHVFPAFGIGGAQVRFAALVEALGDQFSHTVMALHGDDAAASLLAPGAPVAFSPPPTGRGMVGRLAAYAARLHQLSPDLLLTYNWGAMEVALANRGRAPHLHMEDGFGPDEAHRQLWRRVWTRRLALARSEVVVPSLTLQQIAVDVWRLPRQRVRYIPNGVVPRSSYATALEILAPDLPPELPRIVWAGALRPEKNLTRLLRAFAPLKDQAALVLIGDGAERPTVLEEAARLDIGRQVHMVGQRDDARDLIMQCDVLALSSDTEQMPIVVLEAMDAALPVAACDVGDVRHMVAPENRPFIGPPSVDSLRWALTRLAGDPGLRRRIGVANRVRSRQLFSRTRMVEAYRSLLVSRAAGAERS
jgi:glycosyltransferase involved in cell wall biosynthesis